ncbi:hypothetical protein DFR86_10170 [Acidianus sulfidivorans JP7]|uniref:Uncharacterized protein n=1 Tax=Acidianus sulfidivorans JP7 TaxID=619593 RepID=A0A2U9IP92_9CREN|nr:hypothetical protein [Acidianus sulfidivorans]AWR97868.1 hypothetical protein DFR86_10170 [Acidianus sulfidivorans JP7]
MEFLDKKKRILLIGISQKGPAGMTYDELISTFSYFMTKDSIQKNIEDLYFSGEINILRDENEIRYIASNKVRNSLIALELQKFKITKFLENVKNKSSELAKIQDKNVQIQELEKIGKEGLEIISQGIISLLKEFPELTIPEYLEMVEVINNEFLDKISSIIFPKMTEEETQQFLTLISKYRGSKDVEAIKKIMQTLKTNVYKEK